MVPCERKANMARLSKLIFFKTTYETQILNLTFRKIGDIQMIVCFVK